MDELKPSEIEDIKKLLGRAPNLVELSTFSAMWSERCSLKSSVKWLKTLPMEGKHILASPAGGDLRLVQLGDGLACAFRIETQSAASKAETRHADPPEFSSAALDLLSKGARPVAECHSLDLGKPELPEVKQTLEWALKQASQKEQPASTSVWFSESFNENGFVSALSAGLVGTGKIVWPMAGEAGNLVFIAGSLVDENSASGSLPSLSEACLEAVQNGGIVGMQRIGYGGMACPAAEMSAGAGLGMALHLDGISDQQPELSPEEILLSESGRRMFIVCQAGSGEALREVFARWKVGCIHIGEVTDTGLVECFFKNNKIAAVPAIALVRGGDAPILDREHERPAYFSQIAKFNLHKIGARKDLAEAAKKLLASPNLAARQRIFNLADSKKEAGLCSLVPLPTGNLERAILLSTGGNPAYLYANPFVGSMIAMAEAAAKIVCSGGTPIAASCSLRFGNPADKEVYYQFAHVMKGLGDACRKFDTPIASEDIRFDEQARKGKSLQPVLVAGMLGVLDEMKRHTTPAFKSEGDLIFMLGNFSNDFGSSEYLRAVHGNRLSPAPVFDLHEEYELQHLVMQLIRREFLLSAHPVAVGGLFACLLESALLGGLGFDIETVETFRKDCFLFGESQSRIVVTISPEMEDEFQNYLINHNVSFTKLGEVFGTELRINEENFGSVSRFG